MFFDKGQNKRLFRLEGLFTEYTLQLSNWDFVRGQGMGYSNDPNRKHNGLATTF